MRFESEWPGDAIAAPICRTYDREDVLFDSLAGRPWNRARQPLGRDRPPVYRDCSDRFGGLARIDQVNRFGRCRVVAENTSRTRGSPHQSGLGEDRRPNAEGHRNFPPRDRVCERSTILELTVR